MKKNVLLILGFLFCFYGFSIAQTGQIKGKVTDSDDGSGIPGVTVQVKGTTIATQTNGSGDFTINASSGQVLVFSFIGYSSKEEAVGNRSIVNVSLDTDTRALEEVVVTALGVKRSEKAIGYAVSKVDASTVIQKSEPDVLKGLQGKIPGVDIRASQGVPGAATRIQIRGVSSFGLDTQPLIVVDGIPYSNDQVTTRSQSSAGGAYSTGFSDLDPNDIEEMSVLKGAAAAALYGSRASRGVIVITTKSGSGNKGPQPINVSFKSGFSTEEIANIPTFQNKYGAGANFRAIGANGSWGAKFGQGNIYNAGGDVIRKSSTGIDSIPATTWSSYYRAYPELFPNGMIDYTAKPNNVSDMFGTGKLWENSVSINGGGAGTTFNATLSNMKNEGYVPNSNFARNSISVGGQSTYKKLTVGGNVSYSRTNQKGGFFGQVQSFTTQWGRTFTMARNWDIANWPTTTRDGQQIGFNDNQYTNPIWAAEHNVITSVNDRITGRFYAMYKINDWISLNYNLGANNSNLFRDEIIDRGTYGGGGEYALGVMTNDNYRNQEIQSTLMAVFTPQIGDMFSLDVKLGNDVNQRAARRTMMEGVDFIVPGLYNITNTNVKRFPSAYQTKRRLVGFFGDATFGYKNIAFLNVSGRQDITSTLPYKNASYFYPGVSGSLVYSDAFNLRNSWFDYGKIRAGWAKVGNDASPQNGQDVFGLYSEGFMGQPRAERGGTTYDPNLTPEFTSEIELGTDFAFLKNRINGEITWYDKKSTNLIYSITVPRTSGYSSFYTNVGEIRNTGWELGLTVKPVSYKGLNWAIRGIFTKNINTVEKLVEGLDRAPLGYLSYLEPGFPYGYLRGDVSARDANGNLLIDQSTGFVFTDPNPQMIGNPNPDYKLGITNMLSYKGINLSVLWDMTKGGQFYSESINSMLGRGVTRDNEDREWVAIIKGVYGDPVPVPDANGLNRYVPLMVDGQTVPNQTKITSNDLYFAGGGLSSTFATNGADEYSVFDGTVYRLREISIGYDLPKSVVSKMKLNGINVSLSGRNLWYLAPNIPKYINWDPEMSAFGTSQIQGTELSGAPSTRRYGFNINVTF